MGFAQDAYVGAYVEVRTVGESIFPRRDLARSHVFHYSEMGGATPSSCTYLAKPTHGDGFPEGFRAGNVLAGYVPYGALRGVRDVSTVAASRL